MGMQRTARMLRDRDIREMAIDTTPPQTVLSLTGQSKALYDILLSKSPLLADMYYGALCSLANPSNPEYLCQSAHSLRELAEKLPEFIDVEFTARKENLRPRVNQLLPVWEKVRRKKETYHGNWSGTIDNCLTKYLCKSEAFFEWFRLNLPARNAEAAEMIAKMDVAQRKLPVQILELRVREWDSIRDFFVGVSHHRLSGVTEAVMKNWVDVLETFLLDKLSPKTFAEMDEIDAAIMEGENQ